MLKTIVLLLWPGVIGLVYALLCMQGVWRSATINALVVCYVCLLPVICMAALEDWEKNKAGKAKPLNGAL